MEYDNDAELLLAEMEFNDDDSEEEKQMKFRLIDIYNHKLDERLKRKEFVITRGLLDLKEQMRLEKNRTKEEKEIYNMMKVFARFSSAKEHEELVKGIIREKQIRQRIEELKEFKKKGFRTLQEIEEELENKRKKEEKSKKRIDNDVFGVGFGEKVILIYNIKGHNPPRSPQRRPSLEKLEENNIFNQIIRITLQPLQHHLQAVHAD